MINSLQINPAHANTEKNPLGSTLLYINQSVKLISCKQLQDIVDQTGDTNFAG